MTAQREAEGRPGRRALYAIHTSAATPVAIMTGMYSNWSLLIVTNKPLIANTSVREPGRSLKPLFSRSPVPARMSACARIDATPMFSPSHLRSPVGVYR